MFFLQCVLSLFVMASFAQALTVTIAWDDPNNTPPTLTGYRLERSMDHQATWAALPDLPVTPLQTTETLTAAGTVCWRVRAVAGTVVSDPSTVACLTFPHAPVNVRVTLTLSGTVQ